MRLIRFGERGLEKPGVVLENGTRLDVSAFVRDYDEAFFANQGIEELRANLSSVPEVDQSIRLGSPICRPSKIVCIGLNFRDHAKESKMQVPNEPVIFFKAT